MFPAMKTNYYAISIVFHLLEVVKAWQSTRCTSLFRFPTPRSPTTSLPAASTTVGDNVYSQPALYDLAFGYRDYEEEVDFLLTEHHRWAGVPAVSVVELMAGPARHSIIALQREEISSVVCVDVEKAMSDYALDLLAKEIPDDAQQQRFQYRIGDVRDNLDIATKVDTAWILIGSFQHMVNLADAVSCLKAARQVLHDTHGTLFVELPHPRELFKDTECTRNEWTIPLELSDGSDDELHILWGDAANDAFDPLTQIRQHSIAMKLQSKRTRSIETTVPLKSFTAPELEALATLSGFEVAAWYGALEDGIAVDDDYAYRMVCCLRTV